MQDISLYFRALADRKRIDILEYLARHSQVAVSELGEELHMSQPLISWHLRKLRRAGIVKTHRAGRQVLCSLNRPVIARYQARVDSMFDLDGAADQPAASLQPAGHS